MSSTWRMFIAVEMSEPVRRALAEALSALKSLNAPVKWVAPDALHLTLKFLGDVRTDAVPEVLSAMQRCAAACPATCLAVRGVGAFPSLARPRVVFARAEDAPPVLERLAGELNRAMTALGVPSEDRPFQGHVTLGRVKQPRPIPKMTQRLEALADRAFGDVSVERIVLMRSELTPTGPIYTAVGEATLTQAP